MTRIVAMLLALSIALAPGVAAAHAGMDHAPHGGEPAVSVLHGANDCATHDNGEPDIHCCSLAVGHCAQLLARSDGGFVHRDGSGAAAVMPVADRAHAGLAPEIALPPPRT